MFELTERERDFLNKIVDWYRTHDLESQIDTELIMKQMFVGKTRISNLKKSLVAKGFIEPGKGFRLTPTAMESISQPQSAIRITVPVHLPLLGQVRAGRTKQDDLRAYILDRNSLAAEIRTIPSAPDNSDVFLL